MREGASSTRPKRSVMRGEWQAMSDDNEGRASERRRRRASIGVFFGLVLVQRLFFFFLINTVLEFVLLLLCIDCIGVWFSLLSLPATWLWIWFLILYVVVVVVVFFYFFFIFFFYIEFMGGFATFVICWACRELGSVTIFFFSSDFTSIFFLTFFFCLKVEQIYIYIYIYIKFEGVPNTD